MSIEVEQRRIDGWCGQEACVRIPERLDRCQRCLSGTGSGPSGLLEGDQSGTISALRCQLSYEEM